VNRRHFSTAIVSGCLLVAGCAGPAADLPPLPAAGGGPFRLAPEDQIRLTVFEDTRLSGELRVSDAGTVSIPLLGPMRVGGQTISEAEALIRREFQRRQLLQDPGVALQITAYRPIFVLGMVQRGGQFPFQPDMTVLSAVALAGGFNYRAIQDLMSVTRRDATGESREYRAERSSLLQPGDVVTVFERRF
jgi:polysaccharide export outer membrane protein